jgi:hypothetical protein
LRRREALAAMTWTFSSRRFLEPVTTETDDDAGNRLAAG